MSKKVGFGVIGAGMIAAFHARSMQTLPNAELVGFFDVNQDAARRCAEEFHCRAYESLEALLSDPAIEAVTIATPSGMHRPSVISAARAGKHILCEKPLEVTMEKVDELIRVCEENHVLLAPVFQTRFTRPVQLIRRAVCAGRFGRMLLAGARIHWFRDTAYYSGSDWHGTLAADGGGALMNQAIHTVDQLLYLNGAVDAVSAFSGTLTHSIEVEDTLCAALRYRNGSFGTLEASTSCAPGFPRRLELTGSAGSVVLEEEKLVRWEFETPEESDAAIRAEFAGDGIRDGSATPGGIAVDGHACQIADLAEAIRSGRAPMLDGYEGRRTMELIFGIYDSARTGTPHSFHARAHRHEA